MAAEYADDMVHFRDMIGVEEAETLLEWLQGNPAATADFARCTHLHPANLQVLMACSTRVHAWPTDPVLAVWLASALCSQHPGIEHLHGDLAG